MSGGFPDNPSLTDHTIVFFGDIQKNILKKGKFSKCFRCSSSFQIGKQTGVKKTPNKHLKFRFNLIKIDGSFNQHFKS